MSLLNTTTSTHQEQEAGRKKEAISYDWRKIEDTNENRSKQNSTDKEHVKNSACLRKASENVIWDKAAKRVN